jgi:putative nucleotidyltransferase with HDIG domain
LTDRVRYRLAQLLAALGSLARPPDEHEAQQRLSAAEYALFQQMAPYDRAHALRVLGRLREGGVDDPVLLRAALLHDLGKSAGEERIPLLYRGAIVLARSRPRLGAWLFRERPRGDPRRPFYLYATHAQRGAELARAAGCSEEVVALIAAHHDEKATGAARLLQEADRQS